MPRNPSRLAVTAVLVSMTLASASAQTVTVDNSDSGFTLSYGTWETGAFGTPNGADYNWSLTTSFGGVAAECEWRPNLPQTGPYEVSIWYVPGTNRASDAPFVVHHAGGSTPVSINQQVNGQTWVSLGSYNFNAGTSGYVTLGNSASPNVVIADAVRLIGGGALLDLTMAVSPPGAGSTSPADGQSYGYSQDQVVQIAATPLPGNVFDHWEVSGGASPANPLASSTTVTVDQAKTATAFFVEGEGESMFRAFWADAFHAGYKSTAEIDTMVARAVEGNYNAIIPEVMAFQDNVGSGHGAYWNSNIVPKAGDIVGGIDPLAYLVQQAHANGIEVHCWLVAYRVCSTWPPSGNAIMTANPAWLMVPQADMGGGPATVDGYYVLDPGSPEAQEYLASIVRELGSNYEIDGIHWDYIRYTTTNAGYPSDAGYTKSSLARFQDITGFVGTPSTSNSQWNDFRRRSITELVRRIMFEVATVDNPRQPLRHTAALITWGDAPASFSSSNAYALYQNWREWMEEGYLDAGIPMTYYREHNPPHDQWYRNWVDASVGWRYNRQIFTGPGIYLNTFANSLTQMQYALAAGVDGLSTYSYDGTGGGSSWYGYIASNLFTTPATVPEMPWREPVTASDGTVYGRVTDGLTGAPIDDAQILINGFNSGVYTDGNGYFILTQLTAGAGGAIYSIGASYTGYANVTRPTVLIERAGFTEANLAFGSWLPGDYDVDGDVDADDFAHFAPCMTGPDNGPPAAGCDLFDFELDDDVDVIDFQMLQVAAGL
jgi:uncharacterized lipoprotein YddW (UPF0748 family)